MLIDFTKSQGLGNDFIIIEDLNGGLDVTPALVRAICDRRLGVGADGLIVARKSQAADFFMDFRNADGSTAEMCGNGMRAFAKYLFERHLQKASLRIDTLAGVKLVEVEVAGGQVTEVKVDMGEPVFANAAIPVVADGEDFINRPLVFDGRRVPATCLSMGNPHCVIFVDDLNRADVAADGARIETLSIFPERTNVEFVQVVAGDRLRVKVWERGVGETPACGTGACASLVAANVSGACGRDAVIELPGGELSVVWGEDNRVMLSGPAQEVFTGQYEFSPADLKGEKD